MDDKIGLEEKALSKKEILQDEIDEDEKEKGKIR